MVGLKKEFVPRPVVASAGAAQDRRALHEVSELRNAEPGGREVLL
jgi:hypothetical protein